MVELLSVFISDVPDNLLTVNVYRLQAEQRSSGYIETGDFMDYWQT